MSAGGQEAGRFPRRKWYPGYRVSEVDDFIARIEATLSRSASPGQIVTAADVRTVKLRSTRRGGYDQAVVDEALDRYAEELDRVMPEA